MKYPETRADRNIRWIEKYCRVPFGSDVGDSAKLSPDQRKVMVMAYDNPAGGVAPVEIPDEALSSYVMLLHLCGPEAQHKGKLPKLAVKIESVWAAAASSQLRDVLKYEEGLIFCPDLSTRFIYEPRV